MPEGDTIHKLARAIGAGLGGRRLEEVRIDGMPRGDLAGREVERVRAEGKHLWIELAGGLAIRSHLGMHGSWHRYAHGERWRESRKRATLVLTTADDVYVCFAAKELELVEPGASRGFVHEVGPDLVARVPEREELERRRRFFVDPNAPVVDLLLDQRIASGVGNVFNSEVLFLEGVHPLLPERALDPDRRHRLFERAHALLARNLGGGPRVTRADGRGDLWVYDRARLPCARCRTPIRSALMGRGRRRTYWCPTCQPSPEGA